VTLQLQRIAGAGPVLARVQSMAATAAWVFLVLPLLIFSAATFRPGRDLQALQAMSDIGWFVFIMAIVPFIPQALAIGVAVLQDASPTPIYPRWFGYFNIWVAVLFVPGGLLTFFHTGPFDWRGLFPLWIPLTVFGVWLLVIAVLTDSALKRGGSGEAPRGAATESERVPA
jgi:hypothetical protein